MKHHRVLSKQLICQGIIFKPNLYISVFDVWQKKIKALEAYEKEIGKFPHPRSVESLKALAIKRGAESGLKYAEAFMIIKKNNS